MSEAGEVIDVLVPSCNRPAALAVLRYLRATGRTVDTFRRLPRRGMAQQRVMARFGGCAILPSGAYHMELPTTVTARAVDAPYVLPQPEAPT